MICGTTAQFKFYMPYPKDELVWIEIKFWQTNNPSVLLPIVKTKEHCVTYDNQKELFVSLTEEETSRFSDRYKAKLQVRAKHFVTGTIFANTPQLITVYPINDDVNEGDTSTSSIEKYIILDGGSIIGN